MFFFLLTHTFLGVSCVLSFLFCCFRYEQFFGHWIEAEKTPSMFDMLMRCMEVDYSDDNDGSINVVVKGLSL